MKTIARLKTAPFNQLRNAQCGDWRIRRGTIEALSAYMSDERSELAVAIHELIEAWLCRRDMGKDADAQVTAFDALFEEERARGLHRADAENGDDPRAPYQRQHQSATAVERAVCSALGLSWSQHTRNVEAASIV